MKNGVGALFGVCNRKKEKTVNEKSWYLRIVYPKNVIGQSYYTLVIMFVGWHLTFDHHII